MTTPLVPEVRILGVPGIPEVQPGQDVASLVGDALAASGIGLQADDVLVVTHKIVSKAEGRVVSLDGIEPSDLASRWAARYDKDARQVEMVLREAARIVRMERGVLIAETRHGFVCANAGVDASNAGEGVVCLLPIDPDASAERIRAGLADRFGVSPGVIISDSFGRPWRNGIVNVAVGVAGMAPLADYRGQTDAAGYELHVSVLAVADELAASAELVMNKLDAIPVAVIRGYRHPTGGPAGTIRDLVRDPATDMFR